MQGGPGKEGHEQTNLALCSRVVLGLDMSRRQRHHLPLDTIRLEVVARMKRRVSWELGEVFLQSVVEERNS